MPLLDEYEAGYSTAKMETALSLARPELVHEAAILMLNRASFHVIKNDGILCDEALLTFVTLMDCRDKVTNESNGPVVSCA